VLWRRRGRATLDDVVELLHGIGVILMRIDAKLEIIVSDIGEDWDEEAES
jgi:hypothetical protein